MAGQDLKARGAALGARVLGNYLAFAMRTTRWRVVMTPAAREVVYGERQAIVAIWHEFLPLVPLIWQHARASGNRRGLHVLISRHRDGRMISGILARWHLHTVAGSSDRAASNGRPAARKGGASAMRQLLTLIETGTLVGLTPDGPRGPRRRAAPGVAQLAALSGLPVMPVGGLVLPHRRIASWDRMMLPLPFARGVVVCGNPVVVERRDDPGALGRIEAALNAAADEAERRILAGEAA